MKRALLLGAVFVCFETGGTAQTPSPVTHLAQTPPLPHSSRIYETAAKASYAQLPLAFEQNQGQTDKRVRFLSRGVGYELFLTRGEAIFALSNGAADIPCTPRLKAASEPCRNPGDPPRAQGAYLGLKMLGANPAAGVIGADELPGKTNYFFGNDPKNGTRASPILEKSATRTFIRGPISFITAIISNLKLTSSWPPGRTRRRSNSNSKGRAACKWTRMAL